LIHAGFSPISVVPAYPASVRSKNPTCLKAPAEAGDSVTPRHALWRAL